MNINFHKFFNDAIFLLLGQCTKTPFSHTCKNCVNNEKKVWRIEYTEDKLGNCIRKTTELSPIKCKVPVICPNSSHTKSDCVNNTQIFTNITYSLKDGNCDRVESIKKESCGKIVCPKNTNSDSGCINRTRTITRTTYTLEGGKCEAETIIKKEACGEPAPCPKSKDILSECIGNVRNKTSVTYEKKPPNSCIMTETVLTEPCGECPKNENKSTECLNNMQSVTVVEYTLTANGCKEKKTVVTKSCGQKVCPKSYHFSSECKNNKRNTTEVTYSKNCTMHSMITIEPCGDKPCPDDHSSTTPCVNGKKYVTHIKYDKENKCAYKKTREQVACDMPKKCERKPYTYSCDGCVYGKKKILLIYFEDDNGKCIEKSKVKEFVDCGKPLKCPAEEKSESSCVNNKKTVTKIYYVKKGKDCYERLSEEEVPCGEIKCPDNSTMTSDCVENKKTTVQVIHYKSDKGECVSKTIRNVENCGKPKKCPENKNYTGDCINDKRIVSMVIYTQDGYDCKHTIVNTTEPCGQSTCKKNIKLSSDCVDGIKTTVTEVHVYTNGSCVQTKVVEKVSCPRKCPEDSTSWSPCVNNKKWKMNVTYYDNGSACVSKSVNITTFEACGECKEKSYDIVSSDCLDGMKTVYEITYVLNKATGKCDAVKKFKKHIPCDKPCPDDETKVSDCVSNTMTITTMTYHKVNVSDIKRICEKTEKVEYKPCGNCSDSYYETKECTNTTKFKIVYKYYYEMIQNTKTNKYDCDKRQIVHQQKECPKPPKPCDLKDKIVVKQCTNDFIYHIKITYDRDNCTEKSEIIKKIPCGNCTEKPYSYKDKDCDKETNKRAIYSVYYVRNNATGNCTQHRKIIQYEDCQVPEKCLANHTTTTKCINNLIIVTRHEYYRLKESDIKCYEKETIIAKKPCGDCPQNDTIIIVNNCTIDNHKYFFKQVTTRKGVGYDCETQMVLIENKKCSEYHIFNMYI